MAKKKTHSWPRNHFCKKTLRDKYWSMQNKVGDEYYVIRL